MGFERHTFDIVQDMVYEAARKLGKEWKLDYARRYAEDIGKVCTTVSVYDEGHEVYRSMLCDNAAEACMFIVAFIEGMKAASGVE